MVRLTKILILLFCSFIVANGDEFRHKFNYFGNVTGSIISNDNYYIKNYHANSVNTKFRFSPYSKLGFQSTIYNDNTIFVIQTVLKKRDNTSKTITPELNWFNIKYRFNDTNTIKLGRMQTALFLNSDSLDINYLHNLAKDKNIVYALIPMKFYDGIELSRKYNFNNFTITSTLIPYGKTKTNVYEFVKDGILKVSDIKIISFDIQSDNFRLKTSYLDSYFSINIDDTNYINLINNLENQGYDTTRYSYIKKHLQQYNIGIEYSFNNFTITSEYTKFNNSNSLLPKTQAIYTMISYDIDNFRPYIMYSKNKNDKSHFNTQDISNTNLEELLYTTNSSETTYSIGSRYEIRMGIALKLQLDKITTKDYGINHNNTKHREGYTSRYVNTDEKPIYQLTFGISYAF